METFEYKTWVQPFSRILIRIQPDPDPNRI